MTEKEMDALLKRLREIIDENMRRRKDDNKVVHSHKRKHVPSEPHDVYLHQEW